HLLLFEAGFPEDGVGVRVDETRHEDAAAAINYLGIGISVLDVTSGAHHGDATVADGDGGVPENPCVAHFVAFARPRGAGAGYNLGGVYEQKGLWLSHRSGVLTANSRIRQLHACR